MQAKAVCLMALVFATSSATAQWRQWDADFDEDKKAWREIQAQIPAYPKTEDLVLINTGKATLHQFFVDAKSVSLGEDGVMRYTTVVRTGGGATNVTFEGMRCETREQKLYALGRAEKTWVRARDPKWQRIEHREIAPHRYTLFREYFCPSRTQPTPPRQAVDALKRGQGLGRTDG